MVKPPPPLPLFQISCPMFWKSDCEQAKMNFADSKLICWGYPLTDSPRSVDNQSGFLKLCIYKIKGLGRCVLEPEETDGNPQVCGAATKPLSQVRRSKAPYESLEMKGLPSTFLKLLGPPTSSDWREFYALATLKRQLSRSAERNKKGKVL